MGTTGFLPFIFLIDLLVHTAVRSSSFELNRLAEFQKLTAQSYLNPHGAMQQCYHFISMGIFSCWRDSGGKGTFVPLPSGKPQQLQRVSLVKVCVHQCRHIRPGSGRVLLFSVAAITLLVLLSHAHLSHKQM